MEFKVNFFVKAVEINEGLNEQIFYYFSLENGTISVE